jgi:RNA polymerase sigma factor for flagellar operon FliA
MTGTPVADLGSAAGAAEASLWSSLREQGVAEARLALFDLHLPFARNMARRLYRERSRGDIDLADLNQLACEGLLEAIDRFDPGRGAPFRAFAARRISGNIADGVARMSEVREQMSWARRIQRERIRSLGPDTDELTLSAAMDVLTDLAVGLALGFMLEGTSLYVDGEQDEKRAPAPGAGAYESVAWRELTHLLDEELAGLDERERTILHRHYVQGLTFEYLGSLLGITKGRVSQLHKAALIKLRKRMNARGHFRLSQ